MFTKLICVLVFLIAASPVLAAPPTLSLSTPATAYTTEVILADARLSTGISTAPQSDSTPSVIINFGDGYTCNLLACGHAYKRSGTYTITLTGKNTSGETATTSNSIIITDIPTAVGAAIQNLTDSGNAATNATNLQNAVTAAAAANSVEQEIRLNGCWTTTIAGPIEMPVPTASKYITGVWTGLTTTPGLRVTSSACAPVITAPSSGGNNTPALRTPATAPSSPPHHYRWIGVRTKKDNEALPASRLVDIGTDSGGGQTLISKIPHHFIIDRCWFDGGALATSQTTNGVRVYADYVTIINSVFTDFKLIGTGVDTAAISLASGQGPYAFNNNTLNAGSENFNASGGPTELNSATISAATTTSATLSSVTNLALDQNIALPVASNYSEKYSTIVRSISGNDITYDAMPTAPTNGGTALWMATPSFMEFRENYLYKNICWRASNPCYIGQNVQIKNLFELKFGRYFVIDGNVFENTWVKDQDYAIVIAVRGSTVGSGNSPASVVRQVQFSNNIIKNAAKGVTTQGGDPAAPAQLQTDLTFRNNLFQNIGVNWDGGFAGYQWFNFNAANDDVGGVVVQKRVFLIHNTYDNGVPDNVNGAVTDFGSNGGCTDCQMVNNLFQDAGFGIFSSLGFNYTLALSTFFPPGNSSNVNKNLVVNTNGHTYPAASFLTQIANWSNVTFVDYSAGDFTLLPTSLGKNAATDGTDIGVIMSTLSAATAHSRDGQWPVVSTSTLCRWSTNPACQ